MSRKILSLILVVCMFAGIFSTTVFAENNIQYSRISYYLGGSEIFSLSSGEVTAKISVKSETAPNDLLFAVFLYKNNKLETAVMETSPETVSNVVNYDATITVPADLTGVKLVAILWNNVASMEPICASSIVSSGEARLAGITLDGVKIENFSPNTNSYEVELTEEQVKSANPPLIGYTTFDNGAKVVIEDPTEFPGTAKITVTATSGTENVYTINYELSDEIAGKLVTFENVNATATPAVMPLTGDVNLIQGYTLAGQYISPVLLEENLTLIQSVKDLTSYDITLNRDAEISTYAVFDGSGNIAGSYVNDNSWTNDTIGWDIGPENNWPNAAVCGCEIHDHTNGCYCILDNSGDCTGKTRIGSGFDKEPADKFTNQGWFYMNVSSWSNNYCCFGVRYTKNLSKGIKQTINRARKTLGALVTIKWGNWTPRDLVSDIDRCAMVDLSVTDAAVTAEVVSKDDVKKEIIIEGIVSGANEGDFVTIQVLKEGLTSSQVAETTYTSGDDFKRDFIYITQVPANAQGGYSETISMDSKTPGFYQIRVNGKDALELYYMLDSDKDTIINNIKTNVSGAATETDKINYLKNGIVDDPLTPGVNESAMNEGFDISNPKSIWMKAFGIDINNEAIMQSVTEDGMFKVFLGMVDGLTKDNLAQSLRLSSYISALNENKISDITLYKSEFGLEKVSADDADYIAGYNKFFDDTEKSLFVADNYKDKNYTTKAKIESVFKDVVLYKGCNSLVGAYEVEDFIVEFGEDINAEMMTKYNSTEFNTTKKTALHNYINGIASFESVSSFGTITESKIDELLADDEDDGYEGGGSGSGGAAGGTTVTKPIVSTPDVPKVPVIEEKPEAPKGSFSDMKGFDWAAPAVEALAKKGIVSGIGNGKYEPERNVTREEILVMILRAFEVEIGEVISDFTDAAADGWYNGYLAAAKSKGFVSGKPDGTFGIGEAVTREDTAVMAYNIAKAMGIEFNIEKTENFADDAEVSDYATDAVYALKNAEVINGKGEGIFAPKASCTRAEAAKIIYTLISK